MKVGDNIRVIKGKNEGKTGGVIGRYQAQGLERLREEGFIGLWWVEFEDGKQDVIHEPLMEVIEPE
jgi:hypothetical protein